MSSEHRGTIRAENAEVLQQSTFPADQFVLRMHAPECARLARPGSFIHIQCRADIPMRRPLSIMRADGDAGWIEVLYKIGGAGTNALSKATTGDAFSILGPIGNGFRFSNEGANEGDPERPVAILVGGGVGIPPLIFLAERLRAQAGNQTVAFFGSEIPFPFELQESKLAVEGAPETASMSIGLLEEWNIPCRLASAAGLPGCYPGYVTDLTRQWLNNVEDRTRDSVTIYSCGPEPMLEAAAALAREFDVPSQLCLEEFMACAVGGCAGCTVLVQTEKGPAMKRVCVDGPVFAGNSVYPPP